MREILLTIGIYRGVRKCEARNLSNVFCLWINLYIKIKKGSFTHLCVKEVEIVKIC